MSIRFVGPWSFDLQAPLPGAQRLLAAYAARAEGEPLIDDPGEADGSELAIGAPGRTLDDDEDPVGVTYVVSGHQAAFGGVQDLGTAGVQFIGEPGVAWDNGWHQGIDSYRSGYAVRPAGDVDGDGRVDLLIGAPAGGTDGRLLGRAYLVLGPSGG